MGGDKLFVVYDPEDGSRLALEVAYSLARARVLMAKGGVEGLDAPALRAEVERALGAMDDVRRIKLHLTNAAGGIESARAACWRAWPSGCGRTWPRSTRSCWRPTTDRERRLAPEWSRNHPAVRYA